MGPVIYLVKDMTFVGGAGQSWGTDWIPIPAGFQNWQLVFVVKTLLGGSLFTTFQTTWDTDSASSVASATLNLVGPQVIAITSGVGPMGRLFFSPAAGTQLMFSAYLTPKSN